MGDVLAGRLVPRARATGAHFVDVQRAYTLAHAIGALWPAMWPASRRSPLEFALEFASWNLPLGILEFASVPPRKMETLLLGSWWP